jgi:IS5 family transposase
VVGARSFPGNPCDGQTLAPALEQVAILTEQVPDLAVVDRGCRGHGVETTRVLIRGTRRGITPLLARLLRQRSAIEPEIGHMKSDGRLARCPLKAASAMRSSPSSAPAATISAPLAALPGPCSFT